MSSCWALWCREYSGEKVRSYPGFKRNCSLVRKTGRWWFGLQKYLQMYLANKIQSRLGHWGDWAEESTFKLSHEGWKDRGTSFWILGMAWALRWIREEKRGIWVVWREIWRSHLVCNTFLPFRVQLWLLRSSEINLVSSYLAFQKQNRKYHSELHLERWVPFYETLVPVTFIIKIHIHTYTYTCTHKPTEIHVSVCI